MLNFILGLTILFLALCFTVLIGVVIFYIIEKKVLLEWDVLPAYLMLGGVFLAIIIISHEIGSLLNISY